MANVTEYITQIRTARYGAEVRDSIADAITAINNETEATSDSQTSVVDNVTEQLAQYEQVVSQVTDGEDQRIANEEARAANEATRQANEQAREDLETGYVEQARQYAVQAESYAKSDYALTAKSWAVGGTGTRTGEDENNAEYWARQASTTVAGVSSFNTRSGYVMPEYGDYTSDQITHNSATVGAMLGNMSLISSAIAASDLVTAINNLFTYAQSAKGNADTLVNHFNRSTVINELPTENYSYFFSTGQSISVSGGTTLPQYSKGVFITTGGDGAIMAVDSSGNMYSAFRNGSTWGPIKKYLSEVPTQQGSISWRSGWTNVSSQIVKSGNSVQAILYFKKSSSSAISSLETICQFAEGFRPKIGIAASGRGQGTFNTFECLVNTDGEVKIRNYGTTSSVAVPTTVTLELSMSFVA